MPKHAAFWVLCLGATVFLLASCEDKKFLKTKNATKSIQSLAPDNTVAINSYQVRFNPYAKGVFILTLEDGSTYTAGSLDGGTVSSVHALLTDPAVRFDTVRGELIINKTIHP